VNKTRSHNSHILIGKLKLGQETYGSQQNKNRKQKTTHHCILDYMAKSGWWQPLLVAVGWGVMA
jgi:hypothetical protein